MSGLQSDTELERAILLAGTRVAEGWLDQAEAILRPLIAAGESSGPIHSLLGVIAFKLGRHAEGIGHLKHATELAPLTFSYWSDLGVAYRTVGEQGLADAAFQRATRTSDVGTMWNGQVPTDRRTFSTDDGFFRFKVGDYQYEAQIRYGGHRSPHPALTGIVESGRERYRSLITEIRQHRDQLSRLPLNGNYESSEPFWLNTWFPPLDGMVLYTLLRKHNPARFVEIGSGTSTKFARRAVNDGNLRTKLTSIDPQPRAQIDALCDAVIRRKLEDCDPALFDQLQSGDFLFLDSSHRTFQNSDVTVAFLEILPRLKSGIIVHIHDIYLPYDYPRGHAPRMWNEQYMLATALLFGPQAFEIMFPAQFVTRDIQLSTAVKDMIGEGPLTDLHAHGSSFWMLRR